MKKLFKRFITTVLLGTSLALVAGCGGGADKTADSEKEVVVYMGVVEQSAKVIAEEFEKDTGIKVKFVRMSGGETLSRIRAEKNNP